MSVQHHVLASIPSPAQGVWHVGPLAIRAYALAIVVGIVVALLLTRRRWRERGGDPEMVSEVAVWAIPAGIIGGRLYHVLTSWDSYFGVGGTPEYAWQIWRGGLGIWGAIILGALASWVACRRQKVPFPAFLDAVAPGLLLAQGIGRLGNWFNQELFGAPTTLPWGLEIAEKYRPLEYLDQATYHPTFLYELLWNVAAAAMLMWADKRWRLGHGKVFALYVLTYCVGRGGIEMLRIDQATTLGGLRWNVWMSIALAIAAGIALLWLNKKKPGREEPVTLQGPPDNKTNQLPAENVDARTEDESSDMTGPTPGQGAGNTPERPVPASSERNT